MWVLGEVQGEVLLGEVQPQVLLQQFQLPPGAVAGPACSLRGYLSFLKTRMTMMTRMRMRLAAVLVMAIMVRHQGVAGAVETAVGRGLLAIGLGLRLRGG